MSRNHVGLMSPQNIRVAMNRSRIVLPFFLVGERSHVIADAHDLFLCQLKQRCTTHDRFISMTFEKSIGVVLPCLFIIDGTALIAIKDFPCDRVTVLVDFAEVVKHPDNPRRAFVLPNETVLFGEVNESFGNCERMVEKTAFVVAMIFRRCRCIKETSLFELFRDFRVIETLHHGFENLNSVGSFHLRTPFCEYSFHSKTRPGIYHGALLCSSQKHHQAPCR